MSLSAPCRYPIHISSITQSTYVNDISYLIVILISTIMFVCFTNKTVFYNRDNLQIQYHDQCYGCLFTTSSVIYETRRSSIGFKKRFSIISSSQQNSFHNSDIYLFTVHPNTFYTVNYNRILGLHMIFSCWVSN